MTDLAARIVGPTCHPEGIRGSGYIDPLDQQVMLVGISPGREEMKTGVPMTGRSGQLTNGILEAVGWSRDRVYVTNIVCTQCQEPTTEQVVDCRPRLEAEVARVKPKLVILLGQYVSKQFFGDRPFTSPKGGTRGVLDWYSRWGCHVMPTYHPAALLYEDAARFVANDIIRDFSKIREFFNYPPNPKVNFFVVESVGQAQAILNNLPKGPGHFIALDIETPLKDEDETAAIEDPISCFSISDGERTWWFQGAMAAQVVWPQDVQWTFHNGTYDTVAIAQRTGTLLPIVHDTMYMSYALDERGGVHGLKSNARETEGAGWYEEAWGKGAQGTKKKDPETGRFKWIETTWDARRKADPAGFKLYNARDAAYTARIATRYYRRMQEDNVLDLYDNLLIPAVNTYRLMQQYGVRIDGDKVWAMLRAWVPLRDQKMDAIQKLVFEAGGPEHINPRSPLQMRKFMYGTLRLPGGPSTGKDTIEALAGEHPFIDALIDYRHLDKALSTYVAGLFGCVKQSTMRVHPWAKLHGVVTGRVAYFNPAINVTPRAFNPNPYLSQLKQLIIAPPGRVLIELDYKQAEVWMAAVYADDPTMWLDLASGDFHRRTAAYVNKCTEAQVTSWQRAKAKNTTFGQFFLIGARKLAKQNDITLQEAQVYQKEWNGRYPCYQNYVKSCYLEACNNGELVTITGRKRRYPLAGAIGDTSIMPETTNFKIQSTSHDCLLSSIIEAFPVVRALDACIILDIHDAMLIEARRDNWKEVAQRTIEIMRKPRFPGLPSLPVELKVGTSWANLEEVELDECV